MLNDPEEELAPVEVGWAPVDCWEREEENQLSESMVGSRGRGGVGW